VLTERGKQESPAHCCTGDSSCRPGLVTGKGEREEGERAMICLPYVCRFGYLYHNQGYYDMASRLRKYVICPSIVGTIVMAHVAARASSAWRRNDRRHAGVIPRCARYPPVPAA